MRADFLEIEGQKHRVEVNWEAIEIFEDVSGKTIGEFDAMCQKGRLPARYLLIWAFAALCAGASIDKKEPPYGRDDLKKVFTSQHGMAFTRIFLRHYVGVDLAQQTNDAPSPEVKKKTKKARKKWRLFPQRK